MNWFVAVAVVTDCRIVGVVCVVFWHLVDSSLFFLSEPSLVLLVLLALLALLVHRNHQLEYDQKKERRREREKKICSLGCIEGKLCQSHSLLGSEEILNKKNDACSYAFLLLLLLDPPPLLLPLPLPLLLREECCVEKIEKYK